MSSGTVALLAARRPLRVAPGALRNGSLLGTAEL